MADAKLIEYFTAMNNPQFAANQMSLARQQAIAQQMMTEGAQQEPTNQLANPGGQVIANSPIASAGKAIERELGAYMQNSLDQKQLENYKMLANPSGSASPQAIGNAMAGTPSGNPTMQDMINEGVAPEKMKANYTLQNAGPIKEAEQRKTIIDVNGHKVIGDSLFPAQATAPAQPSTPQITQNAPAGNAAIAPVSAPVDINSAAGKNVDWNNPAAAKLADSEAGKTGENSADVAKTLTVMQSNLPMVLARFEKMRGAAKDASYGAGTTAGEDGSPPPMVTLHDMFKDKTAEANGIIQQTSAQGVLPELGPTLAQAGIKGNKFLETLSSNASAIPLHQAPDVKLNTINGLESQYINNLKSTAAQARSHGHKAPTDAEIDAEVSKIRSQPTSSGVTHIYQPGKGIVPMGAQ